MSELFPCPEFVNKSVADHYDRLLATLDESCAFRTSNTLSVFDVLHAHYLIADFFVSEGKGLSLVGPKHMNLVHSAVFRQHVGIGMRRKWEDRFDLCATLMFGLAMDHAFHDANKRTAFLSCLYLLGRVGRTPTVSHREFEDFLVDIADHKLNKYARYQEMVKRGTEDPEVLMISRWLRSRTRDVDHRQYTITYWELKRLLVTHGFDLQDPYGNTIDVVQHETRKPLFRSPRIVTKRILKIGFQSWTSQVPKGVLKQVRESTKLTHDHGIDSQVFFRGGDDLNALISHYQEPLRRLADR
jgi:death-on-curing family protein